MRKIKKSNLLFFIAYAMYFSGLVIEHTSAESASAIKSLLVILSAMCLMLNLFKRRLLNGIILYKNPSILFVVVVVGVIAVLSKDFFILMLVLFGINTEELDDEDISNMFLLSMVLFLLIVFLAVIACILGIIPNINTPRDYGFSDRWAWGGEHSQTYSLIMLYVLLYYYIYKKKMTILDFALGQMITLGIAYFFDARNALYTVELFYIGLLILNIARLISKRFGCIVVKWCEEISRIAMGGMAGVSLVLLGLYANGNSIAIKIDKILTRRISLPLKTFAIHPISFMRVMTFEEYKSALVSTMDNGYYYLIMRYGIAYLLLFIIIAGIVGNYFKKKNIYGCIALIVIAFSCFISNTIVGCYFFPFWIIGMREVNIKFISRNTNIR